LLKNVPRRVGIGRRSSSSRQNGFHRGVTDGLQGQSPRFQLGNRILNGVCLYFARNGLLLGVPGLIMKGWHFSG
jgi:hypothetical protein